MKYFQKIITVRFEFSQRYYLILLCKNTVRFYFYKTILNFSAVVLHICCKFTNAL